jgi:hypothetical protein
MDDGFRDKKILDSFVQQHITFWKNFHFDSDMVSMNGNADDRFPEPTDFLGAFCFLRLLADDSHIREMPFFKMEGESSGRIADIFPMVMAALKYILNAPWWTRIWVIQESVFPNDVEFQTGPFIMPYLCVDKAYENWRKHERFSECCYLEIPWFFNCYSSFEVLSLFDRHQFLRQLWQNYQHVSRLPPILSIFTVFYDFGTTDPRDIVYALLPFTTMWWGEDRLVPNYSLSVSQVYTQTTLKIMAHSPRPLDVLILPVKSKNTSLDLPSWVPDWRNCDPATNWFGNIEKWIAGSSFPIGLPPNTRHSIFLSRYLSVPNVGVDTIVAVGDCIPIVDDEHSSFMNVFEQWVRMVGLHPQQVQQHLVKVCPRCKGADCMILTDQAVKKAFFKTLFEERDPLDRNSFIDFSINEFELVEAAFNGLVSRDQAESVAKNLKETIAGKRLFKTRLGYIGMGPPGILVGDEVRILFGSSVPFVVRPLRSRFRWTELILKMFEKQNHLDGYPFYACEKEPWVVRADFHLLRHRYSTPSTTIIPWKQQYANEVKCSKALLAWRYSSRIFPILDFLSKCVFGLYSGWPATHTVIGGAYVYGAMSNQPIIRKMGQVDQEARTQRLRGHDVPTYRATPSPGESDWNLLENFPNWPVDEIILT